MIEWRLPAHGRLPRQHHRSRRLPHALSRWRPALGYHDHYVVDGGKARIILEALVTPAEVMENQPILDLLWRVCFRWKLRPDQVTGDTTYGTIENIVAIEDAGIRAYVPLPDFDHRTRFYGGDRFTYDPERDDYHCPGGQALRFRKHKHTERMRVYQAPAAACNACPLKAQCTTSTKGRQRHAQLRRGVPRPGAGYHATEPYAKAMRKRQVWVEPLFAEAKDWHGLRRVPVAGTAEGQHRGAADRGRAEPEALARRRRVGAPPCPVRESPGHPQGATMALSRLGVTIASTGRRHSSGQSNARSRAPTTSPEGFFNTLGRYRYRLVAGEGRADRRVPGAASPISWPRGALRRQLS